MDIGDERSVFAIHSLQTPQNDKFGPVEMGSRDSR